MYTNVALEIYTELSREPRTETEQSTNPMSQIPGMEGRARWWDHMCSGIKMIEEIGGWIGAQRKNSS